MVALNHALRKHGLALITLWDTVSDQPARLIVHEDNQALIRVCGSGKNPTMRYLHRTHRISVAWLHEIFQRKDVLLAYEVSARMAADIYTKAFNDPDKWRSACLLISVLPPSDLEGILTGTLLPAADGQVKTTGKKSGATKAIRDERNEDGSGVAKQQAYGARSYRIPLVATGLDARDITRRVTYDLESGGNHC